MGSGMVKTYHCLISLVYVYTSPIVWLYLPLSSAILKRELYGYPRGGGGGQQMCAQTDPVLTLVYPSSRGLVLVLGHRHRRRILAGMGTY